MQTIEERLDQLEKRNRRLTAALVVMAVAICAVVTMAATGAKRGDFDVVTAKAIFVKNDAGEIVVALDADDEGNGMVTTIAPNGKRLVELTATVDGEGTFRTYQPNGKKLISLGANANDTGGMMTVIQQDRRGCRPVGR